MAWGISTWLRAVRLLQLVAVLVCAALNGFIIVVNYTRRRSPDATPLVKMEWLICALLLVTAVILLVVHTGKRVKKQAYLTVTVVLDLGLLAVLLATFSTQANGGLPANCSQMSLPFPNLDKYGRPIPDLFSMSEVEQHCNLLKIVFFITCFLIYTYLSTITLSCVSIALNMHLKNKHALVMMNDLSREELGCASPKPEDTRRASRSATSVPMTPVRSYRSEARQSQRMAPAPPSEGVTSPRPSLMNHSPQQQDSGILPVVPARKPVAITLDIPSESSRTGTDAHISSSSSAHGTSTVPSSAPSLSPTIPPSPIQLIPGMISDNSAELAAAAALTTDGPRIFGREGGGAGFYEPGAGGNANGEGSSNRIPGLPPPYSPASPQYLQHEADEAARRRRIEAGESGAKGG